MAESYERGVGSGWSVWVNPMTGLWHWSAYAANRGHRSGVCDTEADAREFGRAMELELVADA